MLELNFIRANKSRVIQGLKIKNFSEEDLQIVEEILSLDDTRKEVQTELDSLLAERNQLSKTIGDLMKAGKRA